MFCIFTIKQKNHNYFKLLVEYNLRSISNTNSQPVQDGDVLKQEFCKILNET